jgi:hypothetical protein
MSNWSCFVIIIIERGLFLELRFGSLMVWVVKKRRGTKNTIQRNEEEKTKIKQKNAKKC